MKAFIVGSVLLTTSMAIAALPPGWERAREIGIVVADMTLHETMHGRPIESITFKGSAGGPQGLHEIYEVRAESCTVEVHLNYQPTPDGVVGPPMFALSVAHAEGCESHWLAAPTQGTVTVQPATTDMAVRMNVDQDGGVRISSRIGGPVVLNGGEIGLTVNGQTFVVETESGKAVYEALAKLRLAIEAAGYRVTEQALPTIDTLELYWTISAP